MTQMNTKKPEIMNKNKRQSETLEQYLECWSEEDLTTIWAFLSSVQEYIEPASSQFTTLADQVHEIGYAKRVTARRQRN